MAQSLRGLAEIIPQTDINSVPLGRQTTLLYGSVKIGKSTFASEFPNSLFLDTEQGTLNLRVPTFESLLKKDRIRNPITKWQDILTATKVLEGILDAEGTIVIDTISETFAICRRYVLDRDGLQHESDAGHGKGFRAVTDEFSTWFRRIRALPYGIICIAHQTEVEIVTKVMKIQKIVPRLDAGLRAIVEPMMDNIWYASTIDTRDGQKRVLQTIGTDKITAGQRGNPPRLPAVIDFTYEALAAAYNQTNNTKENK